MGAHPELPATATLNNETKSLRDIIAAAPTALLGKQCAETYGELPFLFKVLCAGKPLSIQVHPDKQQAAAGFARENAADIPIDAPHRNYKDDNHKCEMSVAVTDMYLVAGFRPIAEIAQNLKLFTSGSTWPDNLPPLNDGGADTIRNLFAALLALPQGTVNAIIDNVVARLAADRDLYNVDDWQYWVLETDAEFAQDGGETRDRGVFAIPFLQLIHLKPLQGVYLPAGTLHAYLHGNVIELMANSNNVLRSGLTPKHIDVDELLNIVDFAAGGPKVIDGRKHGNAWLFDTPADEFGLSYQPLTANSEYTHTSGDNAEILLILTPDANTEVTVNNGSPAPETRHGSTSVFVPPETACAIHTDTDATLFRAATGHAATPTAGAATFRGSQPTTLKFGTSGLRGLITDITDLEAYINARGFLRYLREIGDAQTGTTVSVSGDMRPSTERISAAVAQAIRNEEMQVQYLGRLPTPALTFHGIHHSQPSVMVTGSHIPYDRNGIKFNKSTGEVLKSDEAGILAAVAAVRREEYECTDGLSKFDDDGAFRETADLPAANGSGAMLYTQRYLDFLPSQCLSGRRIVFYQHSAVGRDLIVELLRALGADVIAMGRSEEFVAIDTEDITDDRLQTLQELADEAAREHGAIDAVISTDGDSDRPLMTGIDEKGKVCFCGGDILGVVVADYLRADSITIPISANDLVDLHFTARGLQPLKTQIGSPYVIAGMDAAEGDAKVGWEANGGFLTGSRIQRDGLFLDALPTRDAVLPLVATLHAAVEAEVPVIDLFRRLPPRCSKAGLIDNFDTAVSKALIARLTPNTDAEEIAGSELGNLSETLGRFFTADRGFAAIDRINFIDGVRVFFCNGDIAHLRPSGNAPQLRLYACADTQDRADAMVSMAIAEPDGILRELETWIRSETAG
jgi:phosphomannomutase